MTRSLKKKKKKGGGAGVPLISVILFSRFALPASRFQFDSVTKESDIKTPEALFCEQVTE